MHSDSERGTGRLAEIETAGPSKIVGSVTLARFQCAHDLGLRKVNQMQIVRKSVFLIALSATLFLGLQTSARAYLDPGTGSIILQVLFGGFAGLMVIWKLYWSKFKGMFARDDRRRKGRSVARDETRHGMRRSADPGGDVD